MVVLSGMLEEGEMLVLGGSWLYYNNIDFLDAEGKGSIKPSIGKGRLCLTNQRLLILSAESVLGTSQKHSIDFVACTGLRLRRTSDSIVQKICLCFHTSVYTYDQRTHKLLNYLKLCVPLNQWFFALFIKF